MTQKLLDISTQLISDKLHKKIIKLLVEEQELCNTILKLRIVEKKATIQRGKIRDSRGNK